MDIKQSYNDNLRKLPNEYGDVSVMEMRKQRKTKVQAAYIYVTLDIVILTLPTSLESRF